MVSLVKIKWWFNNQIETDRKLYFSENDEDLIQRIKKAYGSDLYAYYVLPLTDNEEYSVSIYADFKVPINEYVYETDIKEIFN